MKRIFEITSLILVLLLCINYTWCTNHKEENCYEDSIYGCFATNNTRIVTTIKEFENNNDVHIECVVIGYVYLSAVTICLEYDPNVVEPINGPGGHIINTNLNGPVNMGDYLWINPELMGGANSWRTPSTTGQINPLSKLGKQHWTFIKCAQLENKNKLKIEDHGDMVSVYKLFFRKKEGAKLSNETFKYYNRTGAPVTYNEIVLSTTSVRSIGQPAENVFVNPELFTRRIPSTVTTLEATVNGTSVTLAGWAKSEGVTRIPGGNGLDWDNIVETGFIYSKNNVELTIDEYSKKIKINNIEYGFPTTLETDNTFTLGAHTFYMLTTENTENHSIIYIRENLTDLDEEETYYAYAFMKYKFQTSNEYPVLGKRIQFTTTDSHNLFTDENKKIDYKLTIYPNPTLRDNSFSLLLTLPENETPDAIAQFFDMAGKKVSEHKINDYATQMTLKVEKGTYIVRVNLKSDKELISKVVIQ